MTDAELQKMMNDAKAAEAKLASGEISTLGQKSTTSSQSTTQQSQPVYTPNLVSMRTPSGTIATVDTNSDAYKQNIGGQFSGYTPATISAPAATEQAASALATQNKSTENFASDSGSNLQKVTVTPTTTKTENVATEAEKKLAEMAKASETNVFESDMDKAYQRIQNGTASEIDKTNVARAIQQGKYIPSSPIKDVSTQQKITSYIGATQYAKLKASYTPFQLASATYKDANGDIFFKPGYGEANMNSIPREDPQKTSQKITEKVIDAVSKGITEGENKKDTYTKEKPEPETKTQEIKVDTKNTALIDSATKVNNAKKKVDDFNAQIDQLKNDIKKEVEGEASESYITALASVRGEDILKQLKLAQNELDYATNEYNALKTTQASQQDMDIKMLTAGYSKLASTNGLTSDQYITIGNTSYKKPVTTKDYQIVESGGGIYSFDKNSGKLEVLKAPDATDASDIQILGDSTSGYVAYNKNTGVATKINVSTGTVTDKTIVSDGNSYDLSTYATDPNQVNAIKGYMDNMGKFYSPSDIDNYIQENMPNSPIKSSDIVSAASKYGVSWELLTALMQHESLLATSNVAKANNNPGGIIYTGSPTQQSLGITVGTARPASEGGNYAKFPTLQAGVDEVARQLSTRKTQGTTQVELSPVAKAVKEGVIKITDLPAENRGAVAAELSQSGAGTTAKVDEETQQKIDLANNLANNDIGIKTTSGLYRGSILTALSGNWDEQQAFLGGVEQLISGLSLESLIDAKSRGATFGALSDSEMRILAGAATKLGAWAIKDKKTGKISGFKASEEDVKKELQTISNMLSKTTENNNKDSYGFIIGETRTGKDGYTYKYLGNNNWSKQ